MAKSVMAISREARRRVSVDKRNGVFPQRTDAQATAQQRICDSGSAAISAREQNIAWHHISMAKTAWQSRQQRSGVAKAASGISSIA